jgi:hypothetical protein
MCLNIIKATANIMLNGEKQNHFFSAQEWDKGFRFPTPVQYITGIPSWAIRQEKEITGI